MSSTVNPHCVLHESCSLWRLMLRLGYLARHCWGLGGGLCPYQLQVLEQLLNRCNTSQLKRQQVGWFNLAWNDSDLFLTHRWHQCSCTLSMSTLHFSVSACKHCKGDFQLSSVVVLISTSTSEVRYLYYYSLYTTAGLGVYVEFTGGSTIHLFDRLFIAPRRI